jgi:archaellum component FlaF (FlaF/FlaG flagellin family)
MLKKTQTIDRIEIFENGSVQVRTKTIILEDGVQISETLHRHGVSPGNSYAGEDARVKAICAVIHTPVVIAAYKEAQIPA